MIYALWHSCSHHMLLCHLWSIFATRICLPVPTQWWLDPTNSPGAPIACMYQGSHTTPSHLSQASSVVDVTGLMLRSARDERVDRFVMKVGEDGWHWRGKMCCHEGTLPWLCGASIGAGLFFGGVRVEWDGCPMRWGTKKKVVCGGRKGVGYEGMLIICNWQLVTWQLVTQKACKCKLHTQGPQHPYSMMNPGSTTSHMH